MNRIRVVLSGIVAGLAVLAAGGAFADALGGAFAAPTTVATASGPSHPDNIIW